MLSLYRCLLYLYPAAYRYEYGEEMAGVFCEGLSDVRSETWRKGFIAASSIPSS